MGVEIGSAHWAYSGFMRFRKNLAAAEGFDLLTMDGFQGAFGSTTGTPRAWVDTDGRAVTVLRPLLDHSDCDGELTWEECEQVVERVAEIVESWAQRASLDPIEERDVLQGRRLVESMREAIEAKSALVFT